MQVMFLAIALAVTAAKPDSKDAALKQAAATLIEEAEKKLAERAFEDAGSLLVRAHAVDPNPELLYRAGQAYESGGLVDDAVEIYAKYLAETENDAHRADAEQRIQTLMSRTREPEPPAPPPPPTASMRRQRTSLAPWLVIAAGGAGLAAGGIFGSLAAARRESALESQNNLDAANNLGTAKDLAATANIAYVAGGAIAAGGLLWLILSRSSAEAPPVTAAISPSSIVLSGSF